MFLACWTQKLEYGFGHTYIYIFTIHRVPYGVAIYSYIQTSQMNRHVDQTGIDSVYVRGDV